MFVLKLSGIQKYIQTFSTYMYINFSIPDALIPSFKPSFYNNIKPYKFLTQTHKSKSVIIIEKTDIKQ